METSHVIGPVHLVGSSERTDPRDCMVYFVEDGAGGGLLIDTGAGPSWKRILDTIAKLGAEPSAITDLLLTHCHIDHVGGAPPIVEATGCRVWCHAGDLDGICGENPTRTAEGWYGLSYPGVEPDVILGEGMGKCGGSDEVEGPPEGIKGEEPEEEAKAAPAKKGGGGHYSGEGPWPLMVGDNELVIIHTPGHTPGSLCAYMDVVDEGERKRVLFAQDAHGPFDPDWGSDREQWRASIERLMELEADVLCEGHYGIYRSKGSVRGYLAGLLE